MKNLFLLIVSLVLYTNCASAQKIKIKNGIAYADDSAYCKVTGKTGFAGSMETSFSIFGMDDNELVFVNDKNEDGTYELSFLSFNEKIKINKTEFGSAWKKNIVQELFKNKVIADNKINEAGKNKFVLKFKSDEGGSNRGERIISGIRNIASGKGQVTLTERNREADVSIAGNDIKQDFKLIGTFTSTPARNKDADVIITYIIKLPDGETVADFKINSFKAEDNSLYLFRNDRTIIVKGLDGIIIGNEEVMKRVAEVLIENRSL